MRIDHHTACNNLRDDGGSVAVTVALVLVVLFGFAALGIDVGMLYRERAALQAKADMIALGTVPDLDAAQTRAAEGLSNNDPEAVTMEALRVGRYMRNPAVAREARFTEQPTGARSNNAVVVSLSTQTSFSFGSKPVHSGYVAVGEEGVTLRNATARLSRALAFDPSLLGALGVGIVATRLELPVFAEVAGTSATLDRLRCTPSQTDTVAAAFTTAHSPLRPDAGTSVAALYLGGFASDPMTDASPLDPAKLEFSDIAEVDITIVLPLVPDLVLSGVTLQARAHRGRCIAGRDDHIHP